MPFMKIHVLFFGQLKDIAGCAGETVTLPEDARVRDLLNDCAQKIPRMLAMLPALAVAVNQEYANADRVLHEGDEVGLLPPVSGGLEAENLGEIRIVRERID